MEKNQSLTNVQAKIKWFNLFKGYGFVSVENFDDDIFLHYSVVQNMENGSEKLNNNDIILCDLVPGNKGYQVSKIYKIILKDKHPVNCDESPDVQSVSIKWFNPAKGFGFGQLENGEDVFIHANLFKKHKISSIEQGQKMMLLVHFTNYGYEAIDILSMIS